MEEPYETAIRKNFENLCHRLEIDEVITYLCQEGCISQRKLSFIESKATPYERNKEMLRWLRNQPYETFAVFCDGLDHSLQPHLSKQLRKIALQPNDHQSTSRFQYSDSSGTNSGTFTQPQKDSGDNANQLPRGSSTSSNGYIIVAGGLDNYSADGEVASCYAFDIRAGTWSSLPDLPTGRHGGGLVAHNGNVYYISGDSNTGGLKNVLGLSTGQRRWIEGPPLQNIGYSGTNAVSLNGSLYALGGGTPYMEQFDCSSGRYWWSQAPTSQETHFHSGAAVLNGYIYACGTYYNKDSTFCERYNPATNTWSTIKSMNTARTALSMVALNGYLYVIGGADANNERFDPVKNEWSYFSSMQMQKCFIATATDGRNIYAVGGRNDDAKSIKDVNVYSPEFDIWQKKPSYEIEISEASAVFVEQLPV